MGKANFTRREFLKLGSMLAAGLAIPGNAAKVFAEGLQKLSSTVRIVWLQGQSCSGDSISLLNSIEPGPVDLLTRYISLVIHQNIGAAQGSVFMDTIDKAADIGDYILVLEGSIPMGMPGACRIGGRNLEDILLKMIPKAKTVVAVGTCAAFGGIPAAEGNSTKSGSVMDFMKKHNMPTEGRLLNCPSCPTHPKGIIGTLAYVAAKGYPDVVAGKYTPKMFYGMSTHDNCPRYHFYERKMFAKYLGDPEGCLFQLGCLGPLTHTECPQRQWNSGVNWCIRASAPCIGCTSEYFSMKKDFPFYRKGEFQYAVNYSEEQRKGDK